MADVLTDVGETWVIDQLLSVGSFAKAASHVAAGDAAGTAAKADQLSELGEQGDARGALTPTDNGDNVDYVGTVNFSGSFTIRRAMLATHVTNDEMVTSHDFADIGVTNGDSIQFTVTLTVS